MSVAVRCRSHYELSTELSLLSDQQLISIVSQEQSNPGWGTNRIISVDGRKVFVKQIAVTELEMSRPYSTKNHFRIPTFYSYGVGSAGFGAFRELAGHIKTTNWVLSGQIQHFPILHHHRIVQMDAAPGPTDEQAESRFRSYLKGWNSSKAVEKFLVQRSKSKHQLLLFIEHIPYQVASWLPNNLRKLDGMFSQVLRTIDLMSASGMIHFDAHAQNWLTDGETFYLTDFGLVLDESFDLSENESDFFRRHQYYDYAQAIHTISNGVALSFFSLPPEKQQVLTEALDLDLNDWRQFSHRLAVNGLSLHQERKLKLSATIVRFLEKYQKIIDTQSEFFVDIAGNLKKNTVYPRGKIKRYLKDSGVLK